MDGFTSKASCWNRRVVWNLAFALFVALLVLANVAQAGAATLEERMQRVVGANGLRGSTSVVAYDAQTHRVIYAHQSGRALIPASNQKLYTAAGLLHGLSPNYRLRTFVALRGSQDGTTFNGNIYLIGGGDPTLSTPAWSRRHYGGKSGKLAELVAAVNAKGITRINGKLVVDETFLDSQRYVSSWRSDFRYEEAEALGGLTVNRSHRTLSMSGSTSRSPDVFAGAVFRSMLKERGVRIAGGTIRNKTPANARVVGTTFAPPLRTLVRYMNTHSDNFTAEILLKNLGALRGGAGTTARGAAVVRRRVELLGLPISNLRVADGSGLSYANKTNAAHIVRLLNAMDGQVDLRTSWLTSLAVNGQEGTLQRRPRVAPYRNKIKGKTGTLRMTSAVSGYATRSNGRRIGFSIVTYRAGSIGNYTKARNLQDALMKIAIR